MSSGAYTLKLSRTLYNDTFRAQLLDENQQVVGSNPTHGSHWDCCVPNVDVLKWTSRSTSVVIIVVLFFM